MMPPFSRFLKNSDGSISLMAALILPILIGIAALAIEYGYGLVTKAERQRTADIAAYAGAVSYNATNSEASIQTAAARIAALNGVEASGITAVLAPSPRGTGNAVIANVSTTNRLLLAPAIGVDPDLHIATRAAANVGVAQVEGCILALDGGQSGVTLSGGTKIVANECAVQSNASVAVPCGTSITTPAVSYNTSAPTAGCDGIQPPSGKTSVTITKAQTPDPLAGNAGVATATARFSTVSAITAPSAPSVSAASVSVGTDLSFPWWNDPNFAPKVTAMGCTASYSSTWSVTCPVGKTYRIGKFEPGPGVKWMFVGSSYDPTNMTFSGTFASANTTTFTQPSGHGVTYSFAGVFTVGGGTTVSFGDGVFNFNQSPVVSGTLSIGVGTLNVRGSLLLKDGTSTFKTSTVNIAQGLKVNGSAQASFVSGTYKIGPNTETCGGGKFSLCVDGSGSATIAGSSVFELPDGVYAGGSGNLKLAAGSSSNSFRLGASNTGYALQSEGSGKVTFGNASLFQLAGNVSVTGGGTCTVFPAAAHHDIKGYFLGGGGIYLGAGVYTIDGYAAFGAHNSGNQSCEGVGSVGVRGEGVTLVLSGKTTASGSCSGQVFCISAGYSNVTLTAPTSGATAKLAVIGPTSGSVTGGALFTAGASGASLSGALYFPKGPIALSGGASLGGGSGQCLQMVGSRVSLSGGTSAASNCVGGSSGSSGTAVTLVQ